MWGIRRFGTFAARAKTNARPLYDVNIVPPPSQLPKKGPVSSRSRWFRRAQIGVAAGAVVYGYDLYFNSSAISRSIRCVYDIMFIGIDYKLNFDKGKDITALHNRSAERLYKLLIVNKGLYIKMGQAIAIQPGLFPPAFQEKFQILFDGAPQDSWHAIEALLKSQLRVSDLSEMFEEFDPRCVASASIAQVHKARLKKNGQLVAVKVQHTQLSNQISWDLACYRNLMWVWGRFLFGVPTAFVTDHVSDRLMKECDFRNEAKNSNRMAAYIANDPSLASKVYVPKIYDEYTTDRVLISEWIDGTPLNQPTKLEKERYSMSTAMDSLMRVYAAQIFDWGHVHCDPHPGNLFLRRVNGKQQLVLLDHGLYIEETARFKQQYAQLWKGIFMVDIPMVRNVAVEWGLGDPDVLASQTLLQMYRSGRNFNEQEERPIYGHDMMKKPKSGSFAEENPLTFEEEQKNADKMKSFLRDITKFPLELIFLGRTMRILQGCNEKFGYPVNRIKIFAVEASHNLVVMENPDRSFRSVLRIWFHNTVFRFTITLTDISHIFTRAYNFVFGTKVDFEEELEDIIIDDELDRLTAT